MSNGIRQLNASFDPLQDRILFSLGAQDGNEFRFWITRRYLLLMWTMLGRVATMFADSRAKGDPLKREALAEIAHHEAQNTADFDTAYEGGTRLPLGAEPVLLAKISIKQDQAGRTSLSLLPDQGQGADIGLDERMTHLLAGLLQRTAIAAEWQVTLSPLTPPSMGEATASPKLH